MALMADTICVLQFHIMPKLLTPPAKEF